MQTKLSRRRRLLRVMSVAGLVLATVGVASLPASGEGDADADFQSLAARRNWLSYADARPVSPFFGIPGELRPGAPFARSWLDASPGRSECFAALYYPDEVIEEGVLQTTGKYKNETLTRTSNPDVGNGTKQLWAPAGLPGPHTSTNNPSRTDCTSEAVSGVGTGDATMLVDGGYAQTHAMLKDEDRVVDEAVSRVQGVTVGPVRLHNLETTLKLELPLAGEPVVSYSMTIVGLEANGQPALNLGGSGFVLAGQQVAARDLVDQFNDQAAKAGATFKDQSVDYLKLVAPTVHKEEDGSMSVTAPALEISHTDPSRKGQGGSHMGLRLGYASAFALLNELEGVGIEPPTADSELTGGAPVSTSGGSGASSTGSGPSSAFSPAVGSSSGLAGGSAPTARSAQGNAGLSSAGGGLTGTGYSSGMGGSGLDAASAESAAGSGLSGADETALPAATAKPAKAAAAPAPQQLAAIKLAVADTKKAARNTANGMLGGILVLVGGLLFAGGMAIGRLRAA